MQKSTKANNCERRAQSATNPSALSTLEDTHQMGNANPVPKLLNSKQLQDMIIRGESRHPPRYSAVTINYGQESITIRAQSLGDLVTNGITVEDLRSAGERFVANTPYTHGENNCHQVAEFIIDRKARRQTQLNPRTIRMDILLPVIDTIAHRAETTFLSSSCPSASSSFYSPLTAPPSSSGLPVTSSYKDSSSASSTGLLFSFLSPF